MKANSERLKPSSTRRALASLDVHPWRLAMRLRRLSLSVGRRMLMTTERFFLVFLVAMLPGVTVVSIVASLNGYAGFSIRECFPAGGGQGLNHSTEGCCHGCR